MTLRTFLGRGEEINRHQQNDRLLWRCDGRLKFPLTACHAVALSALLGVWDAGLLWDGAARKLPTHENSDLVNSSLHPPPSSSLCPFFMSLLRIPHISMPSLTRSLKGPSTLVRWAGSKYRQVLSPCPPSSKPTKAATGHHVMTHSFKTRLLLSLEHGMFSIGPLKPCVLFLIPPNVANTGTSV